VMSPPVSGSRHRAHPSALWRTSVARAVVVVVVVVVVVMLVVMEDEDGVAVSALVIVGAAPVIVGAAVASNEWEMSSSEGITEEAFRAKCYK
jgi:hypothetical protein